MFPYDRVWHLKNCQKLKFVHCYLKLALTVDDLVIYNWAKFKILNLQRSNPGCLSLQT
jgi:hypothetical protein